MNMENIINKMMIIVLLEKNICKKFLNFFFNLIKIFLK